MQNLNEHKNINNSGTVDYWQASIASAYDYSPFGVMLTGRTFEGKQTICEDSTTLITQKPLEEGFNSWGSWTAMGNGLVTYVSGEMQVSNPNTSKKDIGASKTFTTGTGVHNVSFEVIGNTCATVVIWPPSSTPIPIKVSVKDNYGNVVASGNYTTAGTYNLSFTPASTSATYTLEFHMTKASAFCFFRVDDVLVSYDDTTTVTVCKEVEDGYRYGFNSMEKDDQVKGRGNSYDFGARMYDSRLGRFLSLDAFTINFASQSPYSFSGNMPIWAIDQDGDSIRIANTINYSTEKALKIMASTELGAKIYNFYQSNPSVHINIFAYKRKASEAKDNAGAVTLSLGTYLVDYRKNEVIYDKRNKSLIDRFFGYKNPAQSIYDYLNASNFNYNENEVNYFVGRNFTNGINSLLDEYDLAFVLYHEFKAHIADGIGNGKVEHQAFGSFKFIPGMKLFDKENKTVVDYGTDSWSIFKQILSKKIADGKGTKTNIKDLKYMKDYEVSQENKE